MVVVNRFAEQHAADLRRYRAEAVAEAAEASRAAGHPADVVAAAELRAGRRWDETHPTYLMEAS